jgi:hypothetical protein
MAETVLHFNGFSAFLGASLTLFGAAPPMFGAAFPVFGAAITRSWALSTEQVLRGSEIAARLLQYSIA